MLIYVTMGICILKFIYKIPIKYLIEFSGFGVIKKLFILAVFLTTIFLSSNVGYSGNFATITKNSEIMAALNALESIGRSDVIAILNGKNATGEPIRVMFRDLSIYGANKCEALTTKTQSGKVVIYINQQHKGAPTEAIACLIAHESQHHTMTNTKAEETRAWLKEVSTWNAFVRRDRTVALSGHPLVKRENYIAKLNARDNGVGGEIKKIIAQNPVYAGLN
ncbi:MAG: hypothetical protein LUE64_00200 [Candidatus Gastranaerophilales bacterium]|nr:hypothetical protein [Candidatus Gastranaerophilales bacterium]